MQISNDELVRRQQLPLGSKVGMTLLKIREYYDYHKGKVYVSFSGGKDSTVLLHLVRSLYPDVIAVYVNTGLEYPEINEFVETICNVTTLRPKLPFTKVIEKYGYPLVSKEVSQKLYEIRTTNSEFLKNKRMYGDENGNGKLPYKWRLLIKSDIKISNKCCDVMKKEPCKRFEKETGLHPIVGTMAEDSRLRKTSYLKTGCNSFDSKRPMSTPLGFWIEEDIWNYIKFNNLAYSSIYDKGYTNTGCMFCMFGTHLETSPNKFQLMKTTHPKLHEYCINKLGCGHCLDLINVDYE